MVNLLRVWVAARLFWLAGRVAGQSLVVVTPGSLLEALRAAYMAGARLAPAAEPFSAGRGPVEVGEA